MATDLRLLVSSRAGALALTVTLGLAWPASAQQTRQLAPGLVPPHADLSDFAWMAGRWRGNGLGAKLEEVYSPPAGGVMLGHFQATDDHGAVFLELITFRQEDGSVVLRLKHFDPDLRAWEEKEKTIDFPLVAVEGNRFYFSGLTIERLGPNEVRHFILLRRKDGSLAEMQTHYWRVR